MQFGSFQIWLLWFGRRAQTELPLLSTVSHHWGKTPGSASGVLELKGFPVSQGTSTISHLVLGPNTVPFQSFTEFPPSGNPSCRVIATLLSTYKAHLSSLGVLFCWVFLVQFFNLPAPIPQVKVSAVLHRVQSLEASAESRDNVRLGLLKAHCLHCQTLSVLKTIEI